MHVVYLVHGFPVNGIATSGAANYVANIAQILVQKGHTVDVIVENKTNEDLEWNGIIVHYIRATRGFKDTGRQMSTYKKLLKNLCRSYWYNNEVRKIHNTQKIDIVQSVNSYGLALLRVKKIPYVIRLSDYAPLWSGANRRIFDFNKCIQSKRIDEDLQFLALKRADELVSPSYLVQKLITDKIGKKPKLVESPVLLFDKNQLELVEDNLVKDKYLVTYGALNYRKSIHVLASIIDIVLDKYKDMKYVLIGRDKEILFEEKYIFVSELLNSKLLKNRDRFIFLGEMNDRRRLFSIVKHARLCILPTRVDNLPNTVLESMALGKVIISSTSKNGTSVEQLITDGENGFLAEVDDAEDLIRKICKAMELSSDERSYMEEKAKERVKDLTPEKVYDKMINIYEETIEKFNKRTKGSTDGKTKSAI